MASATAEQLNIAENIFGRTPNELSKTWNMINDNDNAPIDQRLANIKKTGKENFELLKSWNDARALGAPAANKSEKVFMLIPDQSGKLTGMWVDPNSPYDMAIAAQDYDLALTLAEETLLENPDDPDALFQKAYAMHLQGYEQKALHYYEKFIALNPTESAAWHNMGNIMFDMGDYAKAQEYYEQAVKHDPDSIMSRLYLADTLYMLNDMDGYYEQLKIVQGLSASEPEDLLALKDFEDRGFTLTDILAEKEEEKALLFNKEDDPEYIM